MRDRSRPIRARQPCQLTYEEPPEPLTEAQFEASMVSTYGAATAATIEAEYPVPSPPEKLTPTPRRRTHDLQS